MIRINLLGKTKPKTRRSAMSTSAVEFESAGSPNSSNVLAAIIVLAVTAGGIWWYQSQLAQQAADIKKQMDAAQREAQQLAQTKARFEQRQAVKDEYENRVKIIDSLRANQSGPVEL